MEVLRELCNVGTADVQIWREDAMKGASLVSCLLTQKLLHCSETRK